MWLAILPPLSLSFVSRDRPTLAIVRWSPNSWPNGWDATCSMSSHERAHRPMNVLIVARTRVWNGQCIGALSKRNQSLRLYEANWSFPSTTTEYQVGQLWEVGVTKRSNPKPPHIEDVAVNTRRLLGTQADLAQHLVSRITPWSGGIRSLFEGKLQFTSRLRGYIEEPNLPSCSTWFWLPEKDLVQTDLDGKTYYSYGSYDISYVGTVAPVPKLPAGCLVRVSLARWWKPDNADPDFPERCYLQLSGWY